MTQEDINKISTLGLAHVGDGVYGLLTRTYLCELGITTVVALHRETVARVNARSQAKAAAKILPLLTDREREVYKRGRNAHVNSVPKGAELSEYHAATGLEALFGWLYLGEEHGRIEELFTAITEEE